MQDLWGDSLDILKGKRKKKSRSRRGRGKKPYTVQPGDSLFKIAQTLKPGLSDENARIFARHLAKINKIQNPNLIQPGDKLNIDTSGARRDLRYSLATGSSDISIKITAALRAISEGKNPNLRSISRDIKRLPLDDWVIFGDAVQPRMRAKAQRGLHLAVNRLDSLSDAVRSGDSDAAQDILNRIGKKGGGFSQLTGDWSDLGPAIAKVRGRLGPSTTEHEAASRRNLDEIASGVAGGATKDVQSRLAGIKTLAERAKEVLQTTTPAGDPVEEKRVAIAPTKKADLPIAKPERKKGKKQSEFKARMSELRSSRERTKKFLPPSRKISEKGQLFSKRNEAILQEMVAGVKDRTDAHEKRVATKRAETQGGFPGIDAILAKLDKKKPTVDTSVAQVATGLAPPFGRVVKKKKRTVAPVTTKRTKQNSVDSETIERFELALRSNDWDTVNKIRKDQKSAGKYVGGLDWAINDWKKHVKLGRTGHSVVDDPRTHSGGGGRQVIQGDSKKVPSATDRAPSTTDRAPQKDAGPKKEYVFRIRRLTKRPPVAINPVEREQIGQAAKTRAPLPARRPAGDTPQKVSYRKFPTRASVA